MDKADDSHRGKDLAGAQERGASGRVTAQSGTSRRKLSIAVALAVMASISLASLGVLAAVSSQVTVRSSGVIASATVGVYQDSTLTTKLSSINWGTLSPGGNKSVVAYVKNEGTVPVTLALSAANWSPTTASSYMTLSWDYNGVALSPGTSVRVTLKLTVSSSTTGITSFSLDVVITATG